MLPGGLGDRAPALHLRQDAHDLLLAVTRALHERPSFTTLYCTILSLQLARFFGGRSLALGFSMHQAVGTPTAMMPFTAAGQCVSFIVHGIGVEELPPYSLGYVNLAAQAGAQSGINT